MNTFGRVTAGLVSITLGLTIAVLASTQDKSETSSVQGAATNAGSDGAATSNVSRATVKVTPNHLSLARVRGAVETRRLQLHATSDAIKEVNLIASDLTRADGYAVLPADKISFKTDSKHIDAGGVRVWEAVFNLDGSPSGEFSGDLLVKYQGGEQVIPVTVRVRDHWMWPLLLLLAGIIISLGLSSYRGRGRPRDEVLVRMDQLSAQMRSDAELGQPFRQHIKEHLISVEAGLRGEKWDAARMAITQAEVVWDKWRKWRADWMAQFASLDELEKSLETGGRDPNIHYLQILRERLKTVARDAPDMDAPAVLRKVLNEVREQIYHYERLAVQIEELSERRTQSKLPSPRDEHWKGVALRFERELDTLSPEGESRYQALEKEVEQALQELTQEIALLGYPIDNRTRGEQVVPSVTQVLPLVPSIRPVSAVAAAASALTRLQWFTWISYVLVVVLLAGIGFSELYIAKPTFGANAWGDYFAILAWGFGAEFTTASIKGMASNWGIYSTS